MGVLGSLGSLNVLLSADTAQFTSAMDKAAYSAEKSLHKIGIFTKLSSTAIIAAFVANMKSALDFAQSIDNMSKRLGMTSKQMSILSYAAKMSDIDIGSLEAAIGKMYITAYKTPNLFEDLGIKVKDSSGRMRDGYEIFVDTMEVLKKFPDGAGKSTAAVLMFGKSGRDIVPLFTSGTESIKAFGEEAQKLGVIVDEGMAKRAEKFDQFIKRAQEATKGFSFQMIEYLSNWKNLLPVGQKQLIDFISSIAGGTKATKDSTEADKAKSKALAEQTLAFEQAAEAAEKRKKQEEEGQKLTESLRTAQEKYNDEITSYNDLLSAGTITQETYTRAVAKSKDALTEAEQKTNKLKDAAKDMGFTFSSAFEDAIIEGKKFSEVLISLLQDIERIILRTAITAPLTDAISSGISSMFSNHASTTSTYTGMVDYGMGSNLLTSAHGNIFSNNRLIPFLNGGLITRPTLFPMANGGVGLAGEAGDEAIMPLFRTGSGDLGVKSGGGGVEVNVYAPEGSKVSQNSQKIGDKEQINIMIDEAVAGSVGKPGSKTYKALKNSFGLRQSLTTR